MTSQLPPDSGGMDVDEEAEPRTPKPQPVVDAGPIDQRMFSQIDQGVVRDRVEYSVRAMVEDVQGARKDPVWRSYLADLGQDDVQQFFDEGHPIPVGWLTPLPQLKPKEKAKMTLPQVSKLFKEEMLGEDILQKGANQPGLWKPDGQESIVEGPRNYSAEYDLLLANTVSQALINLLTADDVSVTEVQAMILKDRILISANEKSAVAELVGTTVPKILADPPSSVQKAAAERQKYLSDISSVTRGKASERGEESFILMAASSSINPEQAPALSTITGILKTDNYVVNGGGDAVGYITNAQGKGKIVLISAAGFCHAEQNLLVGLAKSSYSGPVTVAGGKRPCCVCHVALALVHRYKYNQLRYIERHGGGWFGSSRSSFSKLAAALSTPMETVRKMAKEVLPQEQYATAFGSDAPESETITDLRGKVLRKEVATDMLPPPAKVPVGLTTGYDEFLPDPERVKKEDRFEEDYEISAEDDSTDPDELSELAADNPTPEQLARIQQDLDNQSDDSGSMDVDEDDI